MVSLARSCGRRWRGGGARLVIDLRKSAHVHKRLLIPVAALPFSLPPSTSSLTRPSPPSSSPSSHKMATSFVIGMGLLMSTFAPRVLAEGPLTDQIFHYPDQIVSFPSDFDVGTLRCSTGASSRR